MEDFSNVDETDRSAALGADGDLAPDRQSQSLYDQLKKEVTDRGMEVKETLKKFQGKVFHAVNTTHGIMLRYRIGLDGKITLEKRLKGIYVQAEKLHEAQQNLVQAGKEVPIKAKRTWRKAVTGDPEKRIRDHMKETPQVKMLDKISFTMGVIVICLSEWLILRQPNLFAYFYYTIMAILLAYRYYDYSLQKAELFMLDFCYFINFSVVLQTAFFPDNLLWFKANYVLCMGPICIAIMVWKNSLVFHSLDKLTSFFLHAFPTMVCHLYRWRIVEHSLKFHDEYIGWEAHFAYPLGIYVAWQIGYLFMTEVVLHQRLEADQEIITSQRYLTRDKKNGITKFATKMCKKYGFMEESAQFDPESMLAKVVFVLSQVVYTLLTILHPPLLFKSYYLSCVFLVFVFTTAVWNGASYYIEIFSTRYNLKYVAIEAKAKKERTESESVGSSQDGHTDDLDEFDDDFAEALDDIDVNELLANHMLMEHDDVDDATISSTSSKDESIKVSSEMSEEPIKPEEVADSVADQTS